MSCDVWFVSSNRHKYAEAKGILGELGIRANHLRITLPEVQSSSQAAISKAKADAAFAMYGRPVLVEDAGLHVESLGGFPGPYSSFAYSTIGNRGILRLVGRERAARFVSVVSYRDGRASRSFCGTIHGRISRSARGQGWGFDPIFMPAGRSRTFAELHDKDDISHRSMALSKFARWHRRQSSGP